MNISHGTAHKVPADWKKLLLDNIKLHAAWEDITPLARNEWICWIISVKKIETREKHLIQAKEQLLAGERRPCCWPGCTHR